MLVDQLAKVIGQAHGDALDTLTRALWAGVTAGQISDEDATRLSAGIEARRLTERATNGRGPNRGTITLRPKPQRPADRTKALERCRRWAAAGRMPPTIAMKFTQGEQAALAVIAADVSKREFCDKAIGAIAALAGVSESTVKRAVRQAKVLGLLTVQERRLSKFRNDTNIVRIVSSAWVSWLALRGTRGGVQRCTGTSTSSLKRGCERQKEKAAGGRQGLRSQNHNRLGFGKTKLKRGGDIPVTNEGVPAIERPLSHG